MTDPNAVVRRLGPPPGSSLGETASLAALVVGAAGHAWRLATPADERDDSLLAAVRRRGRATSRELADAIDLTPAAVRARLAELVDVGRSAAPATAPPSATRG